MIGKRNFLIILFVFLLVSMGGVFASDINQTSEDSLTQDDSGELLADSPANFTSLQNEIDDNDEISLNKNYTFDEASDNDIVVNKSITINGNGNTINPQLKANITVVNASNAVFKNINFLNVDTICLKNVTNAIFENCKFINSTSSNGVISFSGGSLTVNDCEFINSSAKKYEKIIDNYYDHVKVVSYPGVSMIYANATGEVAIKKSKFKNSRFTDYGIYIENATTIIMDGNDFEKNYAEFETWTLNSTNDEYYLDRIQYCANHYGYGLDSKETLIYVKSINMEFSNSNFNNNELRYGVNIESNNTSIKNINTSDSKINYLFTISADSYVDVENLNLKNLSSYVYGYVWNERLNNFTYYLQSGEGYVANIYSTDYNNNINVSLKNINALDIYSLEGLISVRNSFNFDIENLNVDNFDTSLTQIYWDDASQQYVNIRNLDETDKIINVKSENNSKISNVTINNAILGEFSGCIYIEGGNASITDVSIKNVTGKQLPLIAYERFGVVDSLNQVNIEHVSFEDIYPSLYQDIYFYEGKYYYEYSNFEGPSAISIQSYSDVKMNDISLTNFNAALNEANIIHIDSHNLNVSNVTFKDSCMKSVSEAGYLLGVSAYGNVSVENIFVENILDMDDIRAYYDDSIGSYIWSNSTCNGGPSININSKENVILSNISIINSKSKTEEGLINVHSSGNINVSDIVLENISGKNSSSYYYNNVNGQYIFENKTCDSYNGLMLQTGRNLDISNILINNLYSAGSGEAAFMEIYASNITMDNINMTNSVIAGGEGETILVSANENLFISNILVDNIGNSGSNRTWYNQWSEQYEWEYTLDAFGFNMYSSSSLNTSIYNMTISNVYGGYGGTMNIVSNYGNVTVDNFIMENISVANHTETYYDDSIEACVSDVNYDGAGASFDISNGNGNVALTNIKIDNVNFGGEGAGSFTIDSNNLTMQNVTLSNIDSQLCYRIYFDPSIRQYIYEYNPDIEYFIKIYVENNIDINYLTIENLPKIEKSIMIDGTNITIDNSIFRNMSSGFNYSSFDKDSRKYIIEDNSDGTPIHIIGYNSVIVKNSRIEDINCGDGALRVSEAYSQIDNCTFKNINASRYQIYYDSDTWKYTTEFEDAYGSAIVIDSSYSLISNSRFIDCSSDYGGALYIRSPINITGSSFENCSAKYGGAIYVSDYNFNISNSNFTSNNATDGGAVYLGEYAYGNTLYNILFLKNTAAHDGGAVYIFANEDDNNLINESTFIGNHANYNGGAFFYNNTIDEEFFEDYEWYNRTVMFSDGLKTLQGRHALILNSMFENNTDYTLNIIAKDSAIGANQTVVIYIAPDAKGFVNVNVTDENGNFLIQDKFELVNGLATIPLGRLSIGQYNISANYSDYNYTGDKLYHYHINSTLFNVYNHFLNVTANETIFADENVTITATLNNLTTGTVNITISNSTDNLTFNDIPVVNGTVIYDISGLWEGNYNVTVVYNGDEIFHTISNRTTFTVIKRDSLVNVSANTTIYGNNATIVVEVPNTQIGNVTITVNNQTYSAEITNGRVEFSVGNLNVQNWQVNVTFLENRIYNSNTNKTSFDVIKANLTANVTGKNVTVLDNVSFSIEVPEDFNGKVKITVDGKTYDGNVSETIEMAKLFAGNKTAEVTFYDDNNYNNLTLKVNFTVSAIRPTINVTIDDVTYPNKTIALINISDYANGTVNVTVDGKIFNGTVKNGKASVDLVGLSAGDKTAIIDFYTSDAYNSDANTTTTFKVKKAQTFIILTNDKNKIIATLPENVTGSLSLYVGGKEYIVPINDGQAILKDKLSFGNNSVVAIYNGDVNYTYAVNSSNLVLDKLESFVNVTAKETIYGNDAVITVNVPKDQTGFVTITVNNQEYSEEIHDGSAVFNMTGLNVAEYTVNVTYDGDYKYNISKNSTKFNVTKANLTANVIGLNVTVLDNTEFIISVPDDFKGNVKFEGDVAYDGEINSVIILDKLSTGNKTATVTFYGDGNYNNLTLVVNFTVSRVPTVLNVTIDDVTYPDMAVAKINASDMANGTVKITVGDKIFTGTVSNGVGSVNLEGLSGGLKEAVVEFTTIDEYNMNATTNVKFEVYRANSTINITIDGYNVIATVNDGATGNVTFYVNDVEQMVEITGNQAIWENALPIGNNVVIAFYEGNENYTSSRNVSGVIIDRFDSKVNVTASETVYGNNAIITVNVPKVQFGFVTITVNNQTLSEKIQDGVAVFNITGLNVAEYVVNVTYEGDEIYNVSSNATKFNVTKANLTASVMAHNGTVLDNTEFIITVTDDFKGNVKFEGDVTYDGPVSSEIDLAKLSAGNKTATVTFYGDGNYNDLTLVVNFTVSRVPTVLNVTIDDVTYPDMAVAKINASDMANGTVKIIVDEKEFTGTVSNGVGSVNLDGLSAGAKVANIEFTTTDDYNLNATATQRFDVNKAKSSISVVIDGKNVIATVNSGATGNVTFIVDGNEKTIEINNTQAIWENILTIGYNDVVVIYEGNENYTSSKNLTNVTIPKETSYVSVSVNDTVYGNDVVIKVTVPDVQTGFVTITVNTHNMTDEIHNGVAVFTISGLNVAEYAVDVTYDGDDTYDVSSNSTKFNVTKAELNATVNALNITVFENSSFVVSVPDDYNGKVNITVDNVTYSDSANSLILMDKLTVGNKSAHVVFYGDNNYNDLTLDVPFNVADIGIDILTIKADNMTRGWNSPYDYQAAFLDKNGNALANTEVEFKVNGKTYTVKTNEDGIAQLTTSKLAVGVYNITSVNKATGQQVTTQLKIVKRIIENKDLTMEYVDGSYFVVKVIGDDGNIAPVGEIVDMYIHTVHYVAKVDKNGYAKLKINLIPKKYKVIAEYKTFKTTNKVVVKQNLKLVKKTVTIKKGKKLVLKAKIKWSNGKSVKGKVIKFKFRGKVYKAKTNKKGVAKVTIKKKVTKKLKKGKKYNYSATYIKNVVKGKVKIKK